MAEKFLFDTSFEHSTDLEALAEGACKPEVPAEPEPEVPAPPTFSVEELEEARREAWDTGRNDGLQTARQEAEDGLQSLFEDLARQLSGFFEETQTHADQRHCDSVNLSCVLVRKLFPQLSRSQGQAEVMALVEACMEQLREEPRIVVRVQNAKLDQVRHEIEALAAKRGFESKIVFLGEDQMDDSDVRVEWADGGAERDTARQWQEIDEIIARALACPPPIKDEAPAPNSVTPDTNEEPNTEFQHPLGEADPDSGSDARQADSTGGQP